MKQDIAFYFVLAFVVATIVVLLSSLFWEFTQPTISRWISDLWYKTLTLDPKIKTVKRSDTAKLYQAMRANRNKMFKDGTHILSKNYTAKGDRK